MKRVLILVNHDVVIYNFRLELVEKLLSEGYEVHISSPIGEHSNDLKAMGASLHEISFDRHGTNPIDEFRLLNHYKRLMNEIRPIIVFTYTVKCNIYGGIAASSMRIPFCPNITGLGTAINDGGIKGYIIGEMYKKGLRGAERVFFQNEANKEFMLNKGMVSSPYTVLPGSGVNLQRHCYEPYPESSRPLIISYIGRIMRDKGIDELLEAAKSIKEKHPEVIIRLIGFFDGDYENKINVAKTEGIVEYIEQQSNIHPWMIESSAIVLPSYHEGMSNVLLEAAATGRPVIASDIPGCREAFDEGVSGYGFNAHDSEALTEAIEKFLQLPYEKKIVMGKAGRKKMEREFSRTIVVEKYFQELKKVEGENENESL